MESATENTCLGSFDDAGARTVSSGWKSVQWWPSLAGVGFAAFVAFDLFRGDQNGADLAPVVAASGLVYLAAAALGKPWAAWPLFFLSVLVITAAEIGWIHFDPTWGLIGLAVAFFGYGLWRGMVRRHAGLPLQTIAMAGFGAVAAVALVVNGPAGAYLVAAGLLAHAAWDVHHHRANRVVSRSLAEFCFVLDTLLAAAIIVVTALR